MGAEANRRNGTRRARSEDDREARLQAILDAALDVFSEKGYAATRLEDVAARAGVAKGTIYLYVPSKQALFEALIRSAIALPIEALEQRIAALDVPAEMMLRTLFAWMRREVLGTRRKEIARLVLSEAGRFPEIAEFYHREVISRGLGILRRIAETAVARGEFHSDALARFPQLAIAPAVVAIIWGGLFERFEPLDVERLFEAHLELLMRALKEDRS
ncbi:MAG: TetR/AcrR family transcriptional regulator [Pseudomonadota bacterium]|nr:TetR/AcrR family transcriptional regulator [Pseudomonadota bacterium]